jgi:hypothetical protein
MHTNTNTSTHTHVNTATAFTAVTAFTAFTAVTAVTAVTASSTIGTCAFFYSYSALWLRPHIYASMVTFAHNLCNRSSNTSSCAFQDVYFGSAHPLMLFDHTF